MTEPKANTETTCYRCNKPINPEHYKTYYHSFTSTYWCTYECYRAGWDEEISKAINSGFKKNTERPTQ